jgi:Skp family chaperone for outer membrane proteins
MENFRISLKRQVRLGCAVFALALPLVLFSGSLSSSSAHAGFFDTVKGIFQLPEQVDNLQQQYESTKQKLDEATDQLDSVARESKEALQQYKDSEQRLMQENERLARQNEQLQQSIAQLQQSELERSSKYRRTIIMIGTAAALVLLYFVLGRVLRVVLRSR